MESRKTEEIRCGQCRKLLARGLVVVLEIKCPRCGTITHLKATSLPQERQARQTGRRAAEFGDEP